MLTDDFTAARPLRTETALRHEGPTRPTATDEESVAEFAGAERPPVELLGGADARRARISFADFEAEADAMVDKGNDSAIGAARVSARVRERREELQQRQKQGRINLYMSGESGEDVSHGEDEAANSASLAGALFSL